MLLVTMLGCGEFTPPRQKYDPTAKHVVLMFYREGDSQCDADWFKIRLSGNAKRFNRVNIVRDAGMAARFRVSAVPLYVILEEQGRDWREVFRTDALSELDRVTRGRR